MIRDPPSIFEYPTFPAFLEAWLEHKRMSSARFSARWFASRAGEPSNPSLYRNIVSGRRKISLERAKEWASRVFAMDEAEQAQMTDLLLVETAPEEEVPIIARRLRLRRERYLPGATSHIPRMMHDTSSPVVFEVTETYSRLITEVRVEDDNLAILQQRLFEAYIGVLSMYDRPADSDTPSRTVELILRSPSPALDDSPSDA